MTAPHDSAQCRARVAHPTARQAADRHYLAVVAGEIHRLALELRATHRLTPDEARGGA
jgi:hypothetical protein